MRKLFAILLAALLALSLCGCTVNVTTDAAPADVPAASGGPYLVTFAHGETCEVAAGEDLVFTIACAAPTDMGPIAEGEAGSGVTTTSGVITYSNVTLGGPNNYPTAETVTISGISEDCTVTITPNELEAGDFPTVTIGGAAPAAAKDAGVPSGDKASGVPSGDKASGVPSGDKASGAPSSDKASGVPSADKAAGVPSGDKAEAAPAADGPKTVDVVTYSPWVQGDVHLTVTYTMDGGVLTITDVVDNDLGESIFAMVDDMAAIEAAVLEAIG